jgi:hypothetical protein
MACSNIRLPTSHKTATSALPLALVIPVGKPSYAGNWHAIRDFAPPTPKWIWIIEAARGAFRPDFAVLKRRFML